MIRYLFSIIAAVAALNVLNAFADDAPTLYPAPPTTASLAKDSRFFELRTYHAAPGKLEALHSRFRDFTNKLFTKHGMTMVGYWVPMNKDGTCQNTLIYILAFPDRAAHDKAWKEFSEDPEWKTVKAASEKDGKLVEKVDSVIMSATDYSPIK
jgi:hypothetical protein